LDPLVETIDKIMADPQSSRAARTAARNASAETHTANLEAVVDFYRYLLGR
jgi:hypothetical protein